MSIYNLDEVYSEIYKKISNAMDSFLTRIELPRVSIEEILLIYNMVLSENSNGIFYEPGVIRPADSKLGSTVEFDMCPELQNDNMCNKIIKSETDKIISLALRERNVYDTVLSVYQYFVKNFQYAKKNYKEYKFHRMISTFLYRESVCDGFAYAFSMIMNQMNIPCGVVHGRSRLSGDNCLHAWNVIKIENKCYQLDVTWDISSKVDGEKSVDYFLIDDNLMRKDHYWKDFTIPICEDLSKDYYVVKNGGHMKNTNDIINLIREYLRMKKCNISFRYTGIGVDSIINDASLVKMFKEAAQQVGCRYFGVHYGYNVSAGTAYFIVSYQNELK